MEAKMIDTAAESVPGHVWVALDQGGGTMAAVEAAIRMAEALRAELTGLFVEDANLLRLARLPFAGEMGVLSATWRPWESGDAERALRVLAAQLERLLAQAAQQANIRWSFQTVRGEILRDALSLAGAGDVVVFGHASLGQASGAASFPQGGLAASARKPILVVFDASPLSFRALVAGKRFAHQVSAPLHVLIPAIDVLRFTRIRDEALRWLEANDLAPSFHGLSAQEAPALAEAAKSRAGGLLLLPSDIAAAELTSLSALLGRLSCPLVLVR